ncbi:MAG: protein kinase [Anaerolineae bacterium]
MTTKAEVLQKRYVLLEKLGAGGMGAVYRASDRLTGQVLALKRVLAPVDLEGSTPSSESSDLRLALAREFRTLASLRHPHIVTVIDYGFDDDKQPYFTMNLVDGARTLLEAAQDQPLNEQIRLLAELLQALVYLHRRGILHRDLKPGNVLVDTYSTVKVLDFGLSLATSYSLSDMQTGMSGTLAYMAPELFKEEEPTVASDLYAFGVITYELFTGRTPFQSKNIALMINGILSSEPDLSPIHANIQPVLRRLLAKTPAERYINAEEVLRVLSEATGYTPPRETAAIRESFLQSAPLVGRSEEITRLHTLLKETIDGRGSILLIAGESGVGKSRLLDEIRIRALIRGVLVLRGRAVSEGSTPYHAWREPLRMLVLTTPPNDEEAAILKPIVPDIAALLEREVGDAPPVREASEGQMRLFHTVTALLQRQPQPVLLLLEDLQWLGSESLGLISHLAPLLGNMPLTIVGDYRDDEAANLAQMLGAVPVMKLNRLSKANVGELSLAMLGTAGQRSDILNLLHQETEGNAFFLVEVVRALAEEAGQLDDIGKLSLPHKVFAGGVRYVVERRLNRVPEDARQLLKLAAIIGRKIDVPVLAALAPDVEVEAWLTTCANSAVLHVQDERWYFAHNKLRECLLDDMPAAERPLLYRRAAEGIETAYPNSADYLVTLAHLWQVVGDHQKELLYAQQAGFQALQSNASVEAANYLTRAMELLRLLPETSERTEQELSVQLPLSVALMQTRGFTTPVVEEAWLRSQELCTVLDKPQQLVGALFGLCGVYTVGGRHQLGLEMDDVIVALAPRTPYPEATIMQAYYTKTNTLIALGRIKDAIESAKEVLNHYDPALAHHAIATYGVNPGITAKIWIAFGQQVMGFFDQALQTLNAAIGEARALGHPFTLATSLSFAWMYQLRREPHTALVLAQEGHTLAHDYGFHFFELMGMPVLGWALAQQGSPTEGIGILEQYFKIMGAMGGVYLRNYFLGLLADCYIASGRYEDAAQSLNDALQNIEEGSGRFYEPEIYRMSAELALMQEDERKAEQHFLKALEVAQERELPLFELRATTSLARWWQAQGKITEARQRLSHIYNRFTEGFDTSDLQDARALLGELA